MLDINFDYGNEIQTINPVLLISKNDVVLVDCGYLSIASRIDQPCLLLGQPVPRNRPLSA